MPANSEVLTGGKKRYRELIDELCKTAKISDPVPLYESGSFIMEGVPFTIMNPEKIDQDLIIIVADFGEPPKEKRDLVLQRLMETNLYSYCDKEATSFCMSPDNGHVLLMNRFSLSAVTGDSLVLFMTSLAGLVIVWRQSFFIEQVAAEENKSKTKTGA